ncbi:DEAD/DEAH box helicase [Candidatus Gracilibacteria bacterium]|nr:DEAD/DEAH box helicase [Candidatus Gracilibacteria bacterium]
MITLSHSSCATARLFSMKSLFDIGEKNIIITDNTTDISLMQSFAKVVLGQDIYILRTFDEFWMMHEARTGIFCIPTSLLETHGNIEYLKKHSLYEIERNTEQTIENSIEKLIDFGYTHASHLGELATYRREGSIISITDAYTGNTIHIEWFDIEIDSIIEIDGKTEERKYKDKITIKNQKLDTTPIERKIGNLNMDILSLGISNISGKIILIGCDFLPYIEHLREISQIHFTDFHRDESFSMAIDIPTINHIDEFLAFLREKTEDGIVHIYTKFLKTLEEFVVFHSLKNIEIFEVQKPGLESFTKENTLSHTIPELGNILESKKTLITDDIIGQIFVRNRNKKSIAKHLDLLLSLNPGDLVVHREHGIALFHSVIHKNTGNIDREYLELHYAEGDKLFVPLTEIYRVSKYLGKPDVELTKLSGKEWEKTMEKTTEEIEAIALDILETNARRSLAKGRSFAKFRDKEIEFQKAFAYEYTHDQSTAIEEIFEDMESESAMDRLISGDVGFGKTEIAMNAIYKAVLSGTQVAVISPLLVLADEHYETFTERLTPFGVRIGIMTRMNSAKEITETLNDLKNGNIDVIVGTHRLLSEDVKFRKLGLLVIDEEHKFGVTHKERIKKIRAGIDILALSATPIPRSLNLALSGLKKISIIATPPKKKKPIETIITRWNEEIISSAIANEIKRNGQIIILHNRIRGMESLAKEIETIIQISKIEKKPKIIITHGQMPGDQIEDRIHAFKKGEYDILLSTTIIENGVNFLSANTIIIVDPEEFGLASLHQLRGRVGRKDVDAYCYLMYRKPELSKDEKERLITIANNTHLGAGFEIAMRDMEIRGAGDVLGIKQSGRSKDIGLTLYFRLLEERIAELKDEKKKRILTKIELDLSYVLPEKYFLSESDKLNFFREIENIESLEELETLEEEMLPQLGENEGNTNKNLFLLMRSRLILSEYGVIKLSKIGINYVFDLKENTTPNDTKRFLERFDSKNRMILLSVKKIRIESRYWKTIEDFLKDLL